MKDAIEAVCILIALALVMWAVDSEAQVQVLCESIMYPGTTQVFEGQMCPQGWVPA